MIRQHILVIDKDEEYCETLKTFLEEDGYCVITITSGHQARDLHKEFFSLIIMEASKELMDDEVINRFVMDNTNSENRKPIIFSTIIERRGYAIKEFEKHATDYIAKPFSRDEVLMRVRAAIIRMDKRRAAKGEVVYRDIRLIEKKKVCLIYEENVSLTRREFELLYLLITHRGFVFSRDEIAQKIWSGKDVKPHTIDVNITRLRKKIGIYSHNIVARSGYGYGFND